MSRWAVLAASLLGLAAAARADDGRASVSGMMWPSGFVLYYNSQGPLSFVPMSPADVPAHADLLGDVYAQSCQYGLTIPITLTFNGPKVSGVQGDGGYRKALGDLHKQRPDVEGIYDVKVDMHSTTILGTFRRQCTEVHARGFKRKQG